MIEQECSRQFLNIFPLLAWSAPSSQHLIIVIFFLLLFSWETSLANCAGGSCSLCNQRFCFLAVLICYWRFKRTAHCACLKEVISYSWLFGWYQGLWRTNPSAFPKWRYRSNPRPEGPAPGNRHCAETDFSLELRSLEGGSLLSQPLGEWKEELGWGLLSQYQGAEHKGIRPMRPTLPGHNGTSLPTGPLASTTRLGDCSVNLKAQGPTWAALARTGRAWSGVRASWEKVVFTGRARWGKRWGWLAGGQWQPALVNPSCQPYPVISVITVSRKDDREGEVMNRCAMSPQAPTGLESLHLSLPDLVGIGPASPPILCPYLLCLFFECLCVFILISFPKKLSVIKK